MHPEDELLRVTELPQPLGVIDGSVDVVLAGDGGSGTDDEIAGVRASRFELDDSFFHGGLLEPEAFRVVRPKPNRELCIESVDGDGRSWSLTTNDPKPHHVAVRSLGVDDLDGVHAITTFAILSKVPGAM